MNRPFRMSQQSPLDPPAADENARADENVREQVRQQIRPEDAAEVAVSAVDELAEQATDLERLQQEVRNLNEQLLRRAAEFQNYRRRSEQTQAQAEERGREAALAPFLDVFDDLGRSLEAARQVQGTGGAAEALAEGIALVHQKFADALRRQGVEPIEAVGQPFDVGAHEALMQQPAPEGTAPGTVLAEIQRGYRLGDRVLRHARVVVAQ
ncbi:MAG: nucleotide exchange factor GrpE [Rubricoccaceae bacterium]